MTWITWVIGLFQHRPRPASPDPQRVREELTRSDPDFARVRRAQHEAFQTLTAKRIADGLAIRDERRFWERTGRPEGRTDDG